MGCIARLGCLALLVALAAGAWFTRSAWMPERYRPHVAAARDTAWKPITTAGAERTRVALDKLSQPSGQAFQTLSAADLASFAFRAISPSVAQDADSVSARVVGESVSLRAVVQTAELRSSGSLGSLSGLLGEREPVRLTGTVRVIHPGLAEFIVQSLDVRSVPIPASMIPTLIKYVSRARVAGLSENGLPLPIPQYVGDIRVANGKVTLYKSIQ
ncbi:MAG TPA: hypothetical protein VHV78_16045 [Gemmatimonadaceae bacterium]|jgi:hypothetical protein|nr:hypothetical protein [Gemmatimonadaceae bacterium]